MGTATGKRIAETPKNALREDLGFSAPWYCSDIGSRLRQPTRLLFEKYSGLSGSELESHLYSIVRQLKPSERHKTCGGFFG